MAFMVLLRFSNLFASPLGGNLVELLQRDINIFVTKSTAITLRIGSCLACVYRLMDARGKLGEHEGSVRVARGEATLALQVPSKLPKRIHNSIDAQLKHEPIIL